MKAALEILAAIIKWLLSPKAVASREEKDELDEIQEIRKEISTSDVNALIARADRLREEYRLRKRR